MTTAIECRPSGAHSVSSNIRTFEINQRRASCRIRHWSIVLSERARKLVPVTRRAMEIVMIAFPDRLTIQLAYSAAFGAGRLIVVVATAPMLVGGQGTQFPTVISPPAPVGVGWG
jgi:hypothetical protein